MTPCPSVILLLIPLSLSLLLSGSDAKFFPFNSSLDSSYTLKYFTNQAASVYVGGRRVRPKFGLNGLRELKINTCKDILFIMNQKVPGVYGAISAFMVYSGISPVAEDNSALYASRQAIRGFIRNPLIPSTFKRQFVFQYDPDFDTTQISPLFIIAKNLTSYLTDESFAPSGFIEVKNINREIARLRDGTGSRLPPSISNLDLWKTASVVDEVLIDKFPKFKQLFELGALPMYWRDGEVRRGFYALKICNPLCYPDDVFSVLNGCFERPMFS